MNRIAKAWPPALSALLITLSLAPFGWWPLVFVALAPWWVSLAKTDPRGAFRSGWTFGFLFWLAQMNWVRQFVERWTESVLLSAIPWVICGFLGAWYFAGMGWLIQRLWSRGLWWTVPLAWGGMEVARSYVPYLAFPWSLLASPLSAAPELIQGAYSTTIYGVSTWVALSNAVLAAAVSRDGKVWAQLAGAIVVFLGGIFSSVLYLLKGEEPGHTVRVAAGQPGTDMAFGDPATEDQRVATAVPELYDKARAGGAQLLVLPEGLVNGGSTMPPLTAFLVEEDLPVLFGGTRGESPAYQSAFKYDGAWDYADKTRLVIFGEFVPGRDVIPFLKNFKLPTGDLHPGEKTKALKVGEWTIGPLLCFEGLFHNIAQQQVANGAQMLAVMSIDDWYMGSAAPRQLRDGTIWRAVESGLPVVRAASLGSTMIVNRRGDILAELPLGERDVLVRDVVLRPAHPRRGIERAVPWVLLGSLIVLPWLGRPGKKKGPRESP